jgi:hypothetical protein
VDKQGKKRKEGSWVHLAIHEEKFGMKGGASQKASQRWHAVGIRTIQKRE